MIFGAAHIHHLLTHHLAQGMTISRAGKLITFQLMYTTLFGSFASHIFLCTDHLVAPILCHGFCNAMGFPDLSWLRGTYPHRNSMPPALFSFRSLGNLTSQLIQVLVSLLWSELSGLNRFLGFFSTLLTS